MVCKDAFDEEDIHLLESLVKKYLLWIEEHSPQLKNKVKTHLLTHLTDEISAMVHLLDTLNMSLKRGMV